MKATYFVLAVCGFVATAGAGNRAVAAEDSGDPAPRQETTPTLKEITSPRENTYAGMDDGASCALVFTATSDPAGHEGEIAWSVSPSEGVTPATGTGGSFRFTATRPAKYTVTARLGGKSDTVDVTVYRVQLKENYDVPRAKSTSLTATYASGGDTLTWGWRFEWTFTGGKGGTKTSRGVSTAVTLVDGDNAYTATVRMYNASHPEYGSSTSKSATLTVKERDWKNIVPTCAQDNESRYGADDFIKSGDGTVGMERDKDSNSAAIIIPSPYAKGGKWEDGYRIAKVSDANGPNDGYLYISSHSFKIEQETVINRYVKSGAPRPARRVENWYSRNSGFSRDFVAAVKAHEYKGIGEGATGHYGLIEAALGRDNNNLPKYLEKLFLNGSEENFKVAINNIADRIDRDLSTASEEPNVNGNFAARNDYSFFDATNKAWGPKTSSWREF